MENAVKYVLASASTGFLVGGFESGIRQLVQNGEIDWEQLFSDARFAGAMAGLSATLEYALLVDKVPQTAPVETEGAEKVRTQTELDALAADPAHNGRISAKSIAERDVGLGLESQGKVGTLIRDPSGSAEFIDTVTGQKWDVKAFNSQYAPKGYNLNDAMSNINQSLASGENVMLDTRNLTVADLQELTNEISRKGLSNKVLIWP